MPLDGRRPRSRSRSLSRRIPAPARGLPAPRHPRCALRAAPGTGFPCRHPLENRGALEPEPKGLSQRGATAETVLGGSETKSSLSLPSRPHFWFPSVFLSFFIFPYPSPKGCLLFPSSFQASGLQNQTDAPSERRLSCSNVHTRSKLISQHWGIFRLAVN